MRRGIILGNGINLRLEIKELSEEAIKSRFLRKMNGYSPLLVLLVGCGFDKELYSLIEDSANGKIEFLASIVYDYVKSKVRDNSVNLEIRLQDTITCMALSSIFDFSFDYSKLDMNKLPDFSGYDSIFSLNYYEFWDRDKITKYLHGYFDYENWAKERGLFVVSRDREAFSEYKDAINSMKNSNSIVSANINDYIFAPYSISKDVLISVCGLFPGSLFPMDDLFLYSRKTLYQELKQVDTLDIFGMSPYGDKTLIDQINQREKVRIYVHDSESNEEACEWRRLLKCPYEIYDSNAI